MQWLFFLYLFKLRSNADEELEVDARHGTREHRQIFLVEQVVDGSLQREFGPFQGKATFQCQVVHEVARELSGEGDVVRRQGEPLAIITPLGEERPAFP